MTRQGQLLRTSEGAGDDRGGETVEGIYCDKKVDGKGRYS